MLRKLMGLILFLLLLALIIYGLYSLILVAAIEVGPGWDAVKNFIEIMGF